MRTSFKVIGGKLIGQKFEPESRFTTVFYTEVIQENDDSKYYFLTKNSGKNTCRTQKDMFTELRIPNDYASILKRMDEYEME